MRHVSACHFAQMLIRIITLRYHTPLCDSLPVRVGNHPIDKNISLTVNTSVILDSVCHLVGHMYDLRLPVFTADFCIIRS